MKFGILSLGTAVMMSLNVTMGAFASDAVNAYEDCDCVTGLQSYPVGVGAVVYADGDVMVDGVAGASSQPLQIGSEMLVGAGSAEISVGATCVNSIAANTQVWISQPGGDGADLCVKISSDVIAAPVIAAGPAVSPAALAVVGAGVGLAVVLGTRDGASD